MIGDTFWNSWWAILFTGGPVFTSFVCIFNTLYLCRHLSAMLKALENSRQVSVYLAIFESLGVVGKTILIHQIGGMLIWPKLEIRRGFLDAHDAANFPPHLLRLLKINMALLVVSIVWLIIVYVVLKLR
ncbi:hypothetical protein [Pseudomonas tolaasii]|uniref:hypothetical protein n=1 Tax=Pseudomonas tolaasii TaxID=29442 RepID=UPI0012FDED80|nr:hypothetical protein [Pseudomonas tolaasii]